jgi:enoyl-CoA hydratase/carnithine racemase
MSYETLLYEVNRGVATITLNRPAVLNAISQQMIEELQATWTQSRTMPA